MFVFSLLVIPFVWMSHVVNLIRRDTDMPAWGGLIMQFLGMVIFAIACQSDQNSIAHSYLKNIIMQYPGPLDRLWICYLISPIALILFSVFIVAMASALFGIFWICEILKDKILVIAKKRNPKEEVKTESSNWIILYLKGLKNKYCVKITYIKPE